jgi:mRNA interferase HicA
VKYREVAKRLAALGCIELRRKGGGSHRKWYSPQNNKATTIPDWGSSDLSTGTLREAIRQLEISWDEFMQSLEC